MSGRASSVFWALCRAWFFGVVLGVVLGGGLGTLFLPVAGSIMGVVLGVSLGAIAGVGAALLIAPAALFPRSLIGDRIWPGVVAASLTLLLAGKVVFEGFSLRNLLDVTVVLGLACLAGLMSAGFGPTVVRGVRIRLLRSPAAGAVGALVGGVVAVVRFLALEGWSEPALFVGLTMGSLMIGGILGLTLVAFNLLVTKESAAE